MTISKHKFFQLHLKHDKLMFFGKQFAGKELRYFIVFLGLTHVKTFPYYPQSNGIVERFQGTIQKDCTRKKALHDLEHANIIVDSYITFYNNQSQHSANTYITPVDQLAGRDYEIHEERWKEIHVARIKRKYNIPRDEIKLKQN